MARRYYSSTAQRTTLSGGIGAGDTVITVGSVSGFPATKPYTLIINEGTASEEIVEVTDGSGTSLVVTRGVDGTSATSHDAGATVWHGLTARDLDEPNAHVNASSGVHGVSGSVVGTTDTQTLTNKTISGADNTLTDIDLASIPDIAGQLASAVASATAAAAASESAAAASELAAAGSASAADASAIAAAGSANDADASAIAAAASELAAAASQVAAALSESNADASAAAALASENNAAASEAAAAASEAAVDVALTGLSNIDGGAPDETYGGILSSIDGGLA